MKLTNTLTNFFFFGVLAALTTLFSFVSAAPVALLQKRDVFVPPITYPHEGTVWIVNQHHNVTWVNISFHTSSPERIGACLLMWRYFHIGHF